MSKYRYNPFAQFIKLGVRMLKVAWGLSPLSNMVFVLGAFLEIGGTLLSIFATSKLAALLAYYVTGRGETASMWFWLWVDIGCAVAIAIGLWMMSAAKRILYYRTVEWSSNRFHTSLCQLDIADFDNPKTRSLINKVASGFSWQMSNFTEHLYTFMYGLLRFIAITAVVARIAWWVVPILALFLVPSLILENKLQKLHWFLWDEKGGDNRHIFWGLDYLLRRIRSQMELRSLQAKKYVLHKLESMNRNFYTKQEAAFRGLAGNNLLSKILEAFGTAAGAVYLLQRFISGSIQLQEYFFLSGALLRVGGALNAVFGSMTYMQEPMLFAVDFFKLVDRKPTIIDKPGARTISNITAPEITFEHVSFAYPRSEKMIFENLSFTIKAGEHVALVGENGAGKTTIIKLLLRFYPPNEGRILIDGVDLQDIAIESWYDKLATLFQEFNQYPLSISENISIGRSTKRADKSRVQEAAKLSDVTGFVKKYPHQWETVLDSSFKQGVEPSGGQWQRVALARAFYRDAPVLILDEPTSAIDAKAEYDIFNNIFSHYQYRTAIIVSHRFSTVRRAHRIIVLDHGKIIEQGTHTELMKNRGLYHELFTKQAEGYKD